MATSTDAGPVETGHHHGHASHGHGHHGAGPIVAHHFDNLAQQHATVRLGMWLFLVTEVLFFGCVFCAYTVYRLWYPREFEAASTALNPLIAGINSFLLLGSSFTSVLAIRAAYNGNQAALKGWLAATALLGTVFLGFKAREYYVDWQEGLVPGPQRVIVVGPTGEQETRLKFAVALEEALEHKGYYHKNPDELKKVDLDRAQLFFVFYWTMTGFHVIHMIVGIGLWVWQLGLAQAGFFKPQERYVYVEVLALYWHFVELVWIFILPLLYMAGHHSPEGLHL